MLRVEQGWLHGTLGTVTCHNAAVVHDSKVASPLALSSSVWVLDVHPATALS
jgi:hypothetical protein